MRNKILWTLPVIALAIMLGSAIKTYAGTETGHGWLWGGSDDPATLGWISMNNTDPSGAPVGGTNSYGVNIPAVDGSVTGYAWSENYGWISFNASDMAGCPFGGATRVGNTITGGARILSIRDAGSNAGGWLGCVSLDSTTTGSSIAYGVDITKMDGTGTNPTYAWSDELGWIDFSKSQVVTVIVPPPPSSGMLKICPSSATINQGSSQIFRLYYNSGADCSDLTNPVSADAWSKTDPLNVITLGAASGPNTTAAAILDGNMADRTATVTATYTPPSLPLQTATATITVPANLPVCACNLATVASTCSTATFTASGSDCVSQLCTGSKDCNSQWREVAPGN
jgi:hypothetical protein